MSRRCLFLIDVEPDLRCPSPDSNWEGNHLALQQLKTLRYRLEQRTSRPVRFNWFFRLDPQIEHIWGRLDQVTQACPKLLDQVAEWNDHRGVHCHLWKWDDKHRRWYNEFSDSAWEEHCLRSSVKSFADVFGFAPTAVRMGERWMSPTLPPLMRELGIRYDFSIESGVPSEPVFDDPYATALLPDFTSYPTDPWNPDGDPRLTMIPMTASKPHWIRIYRFPYVQRRRVTMNLVLHPQIVAATLREESLRQTQTPMVVVLRAADLAQPWALANYQGVARELESLSNCEWVGVDDAVPACGQ